ncbi:MAG: dihydrodipicolinate reductase [Actinomycetota bacterium]|nr:dihydrodipicolinate reductase [Actinomycetota bacterium]
MTYRVIQWATGGVGRAAIEGIVAHPELELVGTWVHSSAKEGQDAGELAGIGRLGVAATTDVDALIALEADCVVYAPLLPDEDVLCRLLASGLDVVTPLGWVYPAAKDTEALEKACAAGGSTLHGTGIHPGGITERFPLMVSGLTAAITHVRAEEFSDIRTYGAPDVLRDIMLFGAMPEAAMASPMVAWMGAGFGQSVRMVAAELGFAIDDEIQSSNEVAVATAPIDTPMGVIEPGLVAAQRFSWTATVAGEPVMTARVNWLMGEEHLAPAWHFAGKGERFEVELKGDPDVLVTFKGYQPVSVEAGLIRNPGIVATANHCVSAIPYVCAAGPGIKTYLDLPLIAGRAAPHLTR